MSTLLSASQAAKEVGKAVPTITRAIKKGKLSAQRSDEGGYLIDPAELFRVWPAKERNATGTTPNATDDMLGNTTPKSNGETGVLQAELNFLRQLLEDREGTISDLKQERDDWKHQAQTLLIANQNRPEAEHASAGQGGKRGGFLGLFGARG